MSQYQNMEFEKLFLNSHDCTIYLVRDGKNYDRPDWDLNPAPLNLQSGALKTELLGVGG